MVVGSAREGQAPMPGSGDVVRRNAYDLSDCPGEAVVLSQCTSIEGI